jgi:hypothetical protein
MTTAASLVLPHQHAVVDVDDLAKSSLSMTGRQDQLATAPGPGQVVLGPPWSPLM